MTGGCEYFKDYFENTGKGKDEEREGVEDRRDQ
jgi:hypothetical protein